MAELAYHEIDPNGDCDLIVYVSPPEKSDSTETCIQPELDAALLYKRPKEEVEIERLEPVRRGMPRTEISLFIHAGDRNRYDITVQHRFATNTNHIRPQAISTQRNSTPSFQTAANPVLNQVITAPTLASEDHNDHCESEAEFEETGVTPRDYERFKVSTKHLKHSCAYFRRMLNADMAEKAELETKGYITFNFEGHDPLAILHIMHIIHGSFRKVPNRLAMKVLLETAILVDFMECHEVVEPFANSWLRCVPPQTSFSKSLIEWIFITTVFQRKISFSSAVVVAMSQSRGPLDSLDLPIRQSILDSINEKREFALEILISGLYETVGRLQEETVCSFRCDVKKLGFLLKELGSRKLVLSGLSKPYLGYSYDDVKASLESITDTDPTNANPIRDAEQRSIKRRDLPSQSYVEKFVFTEESIWQREHFWNEHQKLGSCCKCSVTKDIERVIKFADEEIEKMLEHNPTLM